MLFKIAAAVVAVFASFGPAMAAWPEKPIRIVVPFGPGGTTDILARTLQKVLDERKIVSQPVAIQNVGGHFSVGARQVMTAQPDGHTFLAIHLALLSGEVVDPARGVSYRNFEPVALECLQRAQRGGEERFTVTADGYGFHFVVHSGFVYVVVADAATGQQLPFACAKRVQDAWTERFWEKGRTAAANGMDKSFG